MLFTPSLFQALHDRQSSDANNVVSVISDPAFVFQLAACDETIRKLKSDLSSVKTEHNRSFHDVSRSAAVHLQALCVFWIPRVHCRDCACCACTRVRAQGTSAFFFARKD